MPWPAAFTGIVKMSATAAALIAPRETEEQDIGASLDTEIGSDQKRLARVAMPTLVIDARALKRAGRYPPTRP